MNLFPRVSVKFRVKVRIMAQVIVRIKVMVRLGAGWLADNLTGNHLVCFVVTATVQLCVDY